MRRTFISLLIAGFLLPWSLEAQTIKGQSIKTHSLKLEKKRTHVVADSVPVICFLSESPLQESSTETKAAFEFLAGQKQFNAEFRTFGEVSGKKPLLSKYRVVWIQGDDTTGYGNSELLRPCSEAVKKYLEQGGSLFLTQQAFHFINLLGLETVIPDDSTKRCIDEGYGRKLGFHAFREHPLFEGMNGGAYIQRPGRDLTTRITGFFGDKRPAQGKVIGVDWDYIFVREDSKLIVEYPTGKGMVVAVGGYIDFTEPNLNRSHLGLFVRNSLNYLSGKYDSQRMFYWDYRNNTVAEGIFRDTLMKPNSLNRKSGPWKIGEDDLTMNKRYASRDYFDEAGERMLIMGEERGGIEEIWAHPFMALRDYEAGIRFAYRDTTYFLNDERPEIEVHPGFLVRTYRFPRAYLKEIIVADPSEPAGVVHYEYHGVYEAELFIRFRSNLRWMWPYSERVTGTIRHSWDSLMKAFVIQDQSGDLNTIIGSSRQPTEKLCGRFDQIEPGKRAKQFTSPASDLFRVAGAMRYDLSATDAIDLVISASDEGFRKTAEEYCKVMADPQKVFANNAQEVSRLFSKSLLITTPDKNFNKGYRWALFSTDRFMVTTPGMGTALVAGYSTTRRGWDGGHKVNGRPGYGWYFGRDGEWSGLALCDYGDFDNVRKELEFFNRYQDLTGKIFHEATTSGFIHYDASDATPLYILLAGRYFRHSNDTAFIRKTWTNIKRAIDFCYSTDTDHDHLIENTNVGHGWVEGGELYGSHATLYMAGCWAAALTEAGNMAKFTGDKDSDNYLAESETVKKIIDRDFWNPKGNFYSYGMNKDGTFRHDPTILPAVPLGFRLAEKEKAVQVLRQYSSNAFSTNWGTRIVRDDSPYFNPSGYHYGSVWPLFTGWTSMAEYAYGNYQQGFSHIMNNLNVYKNWGLGYVEEVLNGSEYKPSGVCPHQCWSETMVLQPAIEGMLGLDINAPKNRMTLSPRLPADWDSLMVENIRTGDRICDFRFRRQDGVYTYTFRFKDGPVAIDFMPVLPAGIVIKSVRVDGTDQPFTMFSTRQYTMAVMQLSPEKEMNIEIETEKGISVLPVVSNPLPGDPAPGLRILSTNLTGSRYLIELEGVPRSDEEIKIYLNDWSIDNIGNGNLLKHSGNIVTIGVNFPPGPDRYSRLNLTINLK